MLLAYYTKSKKNMKLCSLKKIFCPLTRYMIISLINCPYCYRPSLTVDVDLNSVVGTSPKTVYWYTLIFSCIIMLGLLNHMYSCKTGSEVDTVMIKLVLPGRWVCVSHAC